MNQNLKTLGIFLLVATGLFSTLAAYLSTARGLESRLNARFNYNNRLAIEETSAESAAYFKQDRATEDYHHRQSDDYMAVCHEAAVQCQPLTNTRLNQRNLAMAAAIFAGVFALTAFTLARRPA